VLLDRVAAAVDRAAGEVRPIPPGSRSAGAPGMGEGRPPNRPRGSSTAAKVSAAADRVRVLGTWVAVVGVVVSLLLWCFCLRDSRAYVSQFRRRAVPPAAARIAVARKRH
jgi:hypothetical protein